MKSLTEGHHLTHHRRMFWIALYVFPLGWLALFFVSLLKFSVS